VTASASAPVISLVGSPRVFVARSAMNAVATRKMLPASSARWNPDVAATSGAACAASSEFVREVASAEKIASPSAAPTWVDALTSAPARPASDGGTPAFAAVCTPTNSPPSPKAMMTRPGNKSVQ
jgi:hypothetical protein